MNAVRNIYLCPEGTVWHARELCARNLTEGGLVVRRPCAYCGEGHILMPQILQDILYPEATTQPGTTD